MKGTAYVCSYVVVIKGHHNNNHHQQHHHHCLVGVIGNGGNLFVEWISIGWFGEIIWFDYVMKCYVKAFRGEII